MTALQLLILLALAAALFASLLVARVRGSW